MTELEKIAYAKTYIEKLANGIDPLTNQAVPDDDIINNVRISRCLFYVSDILRRVIENEGISQPKAKPAKVPFQLDWEARGKFEYSEIPISISEIARRINRLIQPEEMNKLSYKNITDWLIQAGFLSLITKDDGRTIRRPTEIGKTIGIYTEERQSPTGVYRSGLRQSGAAVYPGQSGRCCSADPKVKEASYMTEVVAALIWDKEKFMICQRPAHKARGLLWEFVGGKVEPGETKEQALIRECREELAITLDVGKVFMDVIHEYPDLTVHLTLFHTAIREGTPQKLEHNDIRWITVHEIDQYAFCPADEEILRRLKDAGKTYHKLVRDRIPEIIEGDGKTCVCETLSDEAYIRLLDQKLNEELAEYQESKSLEELADLLEVMEAVVRARGWTWEELERVRADKAAERGGFAKKIFLTAVKEK